MYIKIKILLFLMLFTPHCIQAQKYRTEPLDIGIRTIQVTKNSNWLERPIIDINSNDYIEISFDRLSKEESQHLRYKIVHCNADWVPSSLSTMDFLDGFNDNSIYDYAESMGTTVEYTNFKLQIPNQEVRLKKSGNYAVIIYEDENPDNNLLTACFSIVDEQISITSKLSSNTDIDSNKEHQQITFEINHPKVNINNPILDLKIYVTQNNRLDNQRLLKAPTHIQNNKLVYLHNKDLIFEAGNEYRRFDFVSSQYNGLNVEYTRYRNPFYQVYLTPVKITAERHYSYDEDHNGRFFIREVDANDSDIEADYFFANFTLQCDYPLSENIYLNGDFTYNNFDNNYLMKYDHIEKTYHTSVLLKQGAYNYQFLVKKGNIYTPALTEGNYYQTENEYLIWVYHRPMGQQYDSLIGVHKINMRN